jgi:hypothetical protein
VLFRRSCISGDAGFRPSLTGAEDYDLYLRVARGSPICCHSQVVAEYRLHPSSASRKSMMMLTHTLAVLSDQWPFARTSFRYAMAYFCGSMSWRRKYGRQLTMEMAMSELELWSQEDRAAWRLLARSYPQGMLMVLIGRMLPRNLLRHMLHRHKENPASQVPGDLYAARRSDKIPL